MPDEFRKVTILADYASRELAGKVHRLLTEKQIPNGLNHFNPDDLYVNRFRSREYQIRIGTNVRGRDVFVFISPLSLTDRWSGGPEEGNYLYLPDSQIVKADLIGDALSQSGASSIRFVMPHQTYQRQDSKSTDAHTGEPKREPLSVRAFSRIVSDYQSQGAKILTVSPHFRQLAAIYPSGGLEEITTRVVFSEYLEKKFGGKLKQLAGFSPDAGAERLVMGICEDVGIVYFGHCGKDRSQPGEVGGLRVYSHLPIEDIKGKIVIIPDDIIDSGGTLITTATQLMELGAKKVYALMAHPILTDNALEKLKDGKLNLVTTDSISHDFSGYPNVDVVSLDYILHEAIASMVSGASISGHLFNYQRFREEKQRRRLW